MSLKQLEKFVLIIGEQGSILIYIVGKSIKHRLFSKSVSDANTQSFTELLKSKPHVPIYILLDTMDQNYTKQSLPAVSSFAIGSLVKKRLERDFSQDDIIGALPIGREKTGRKDWNYLFISASLTDFVEEWVSYTINLPNSFLGVFLLPVECESIIKKLNKVVFKEGEKPARWQFIVMHNKTGGFRQVIFDNQRVIFTRLIRPDRENLPDILAGNIEQEISNTNEYLRRLGFSEQDGLDIFIIVSEEIKKSLESSEIHASKVSLLTPNDIATLCELKQVCEPSDKFADLLVAYLFSVSRKVLKLNTPATKLVSLLIIIRKYMNIVFLVITPIVLAITMYYVFSIISINSNIKSEESRKTNIEKEWRSVQEVGDYSLEEATRIADIISLYTKISTPEAQIVGIIDKLTEVLKGQAIANSVTWDSAFDTLENKTTSASVGVKFHNTGNDLEELFTNFDTFTTSLRTVFEDFEVEHSKLPDVITFGKTQNIIDVDITFKPKSDNQANATGG